MFGDRGGRRAGLALLGALVIAGAAVGPVFAAAPGNDDIGGATVVGGIPYTDGPLDTTEATSGAGDPPFCYGGPGDSATVWYSFTADGSARLQADTVGSDYDTTLYVGTPDGQGGISVIACNDDTFGLQSAVVWDAVPGTTYLFVVGTCCGGAPGAGGGNLVFNLGVAPPPPSIDLTLSGNGSFTRNGAAIIRGTATCAGLPEAEVDVTVSQRVGRKVIRGGAFTLVACTGTAQAWTIEVPGFDGKFAGGQAQVTLDSFGCGAVECASAHIDGTVRLRR